MPAVIEVVDLTISGSEDEEDNARADLRPRQTQDDRSESQLSTQRAGQVDPFIRPALPLSALKAEPSRAATPSKSAGTSGASGLQQAIALALRGSQTLSSPTGSRQSPRANVTVAQTPMRFTPKMMDSWVDEIAEKLKSFAAEISKQNARVVHYTLKEISRNMKGPDPRHVSKVDDFADMTSASITEEADEKTDEHASIKFKQHLGPNQSSRQRRQFFKVNCTMPVKTRVPKYRFHHVEISKNILTPNTTLQFIPHIGDLTAEEETKYYKWLEEIETMDQKTHVPTIALNRPKKIARIIHDEYAATLYVYLDRWIQNLGNEQLNKSALIGYMASQTAEDDNAITPQQKSTLLHSNVGDSGSPLARAAAKVFTVAFDRVFGENVTLRDVLMLDEAVKTIIDNKGAKEVPSSLKPHDEELLQSAEQRLATYAILGCLICFGHDCEHGDFDEHNNKHCFSIDSSMGKLSTLLRRRWVDQLRKKADLPDDIEVQTPCKNQCYLRMSPGFEEPAKWEKDEIAMLKTLFTTLGRSSIKPECAAASLLGRKCWEVHEMLLDLRLKLPNTPVPPELPKAKSITWYDRHRKALIGDWPDCTISHDHSKRDIREYEPCHHDGPCSAANKCPCVTGKLLCERFCQCTADCCPYKFTGCACHSTGKTCLERQKEGRPCICVQLNRECDPVLCKSCGATERADILNAYDEELHATGCQNVPMQRGVSKAVLMGESQLEGVGYGLFTTEEILQDEFIIEYTGELIQQDEGVRREARRDNVFNRAQNSSYLFTLLDTDGIWVDAAIYGNMSRYINHAGEHDKKRANILPKIVYVNGEFRIRFNALRDIKPGEELFFNYGENFPNLTKKRIEEKEKGAKAGGGGKAGGQPKRKVGRPPNPKNAAAKGKQKEVSFAPAPSSKGAAKARNGRRAKATKQAPRSMPVEDSVDWEAEATGDDDPVVPSAPDDVDQPTNKRGGRRRRPVGYVDEIDNSDSASDEYMPGGGSSQSDKDAMHTLRRDRHRRKNATTSSVDAPHQLNNFTSTADDDNAAVEGAEAMVGSSNLKSIPKSAAASPVGTPGSKRAHRRGGARPGAGRKPKNPNPNPETASSPAKRGASEDDDDLSSQESDNGKGGYSTAGDDSDDMPLISPGNHSGRKRRRPPTSSNGSAATGDTTVSDAARKTLAESDITPTKQGRGGRAAGRKRQASEITSDSDGENEEDTPIVLRDRRKRQKPARYRVSEE